LAEAISTEVVSLIREHYHDFGPTLASEKLVEIVSHGVVYES
jgi:hypothetical protein